MKKKNYIIIKKLKKNLVNQILSLNEDEKKKIQNTINEVLKYRVLTDRKSIVTTKLRYNVKNDNFYINLIKATKNFLKYMLIKNNIGNFCFFVDKNNFNYYKLREANIKFKNQDLNFINSYLLKYNDIKNR